MPYSLSFILLENNGFAAHAQLPSWFVTVVVRYRVSCFSFHHRVVFVFIIKTIVNLYNARALC